MDLNFNSDSTYCSLYENSQRNQITKHKDVANSKLLDKVHNDIRLHWEGRKLMGKIEAMQYMKQITKMKLKSYRDKYFAEKIKSSLLKIFNLAKEFERSLSIANISEVSDPIKDCLLTEDLGLLKNTYDPKQVLMGSVNTDKSFPLDLLTNNNFVSPVSPYNRMTNSQEHLIESHVRKESIDSEMDMSDALIEKGNVSSLQFSSSENGGHLQNCSQSQDVGSENFDFNKVYPSKKYVTEISDKITVNEIYLPQSFKNDSHNKKSVIPSQEHVTSSLCPKHGNVDNVSITGISNSSSCNFFKNVDKTEQPIDKSSTSEITDIILKSLNSTAEEGHTFIKDDNFTNTEIPETLSYEGNRSLEKINATIVEKVDLKKVLELGSESGGKTWQEIQKQLEYGEDQARAVSNTLDTLFTKLCLEEREAQEEPFRDKWCKENFHNFSPEDKKELDLYDLSRKNYAKLEKISEEFKIHIDLEVMKSINDEDDDDYDGLDWRILLS